jgi:hypothetical protein
MKKLILVFVVTLLCMVSGLAQTRNIRRVDFLNFTYQSSVCSKEIGGGIGRTVKIRKGEFENSEVYYGVVGNKIIYSDVTGDGREDAIVRIVCGLYVANYGLSEIFVYTMKNGRATLVAKLDNNDMWRDYEHYYPNGTLWSIIWSNRNNGIEIRKGHVIIKTFAEGSHAEPDYIVSLDYELSGAKFALNGKPQRRRRGF